MDSEILATSPKARERAHLQSVQRNRSIPPSPRVRVRTLSPEQEPIRIARFAREESPLPSSSQRRAVGRKSPLHKQQIFLKALARSSASTARPTPSNRASPASTSPTAATVFHAGSRKNHATEIAPTTAKDPNPAPQMTQNGNLDIRSTTTIETPIGRAIQPRDIQNEGFRNLSHLTESQRANAPITSPTNPIDTVKSTGCTKKLNRIIKEREDIIKDPFAELFVCLLWRHPSFRCPS